EAADTVRDLHFVRNVSESYYAIGAIAEAHLQAVRGVKRDICRTCRQPEQQQSEETGS
ncbi:hypothetical protein BaRGS_00038307, partial [Batillaria attramentaria]